MFRSEEVAEPSAFDLVGDDALLLHEFAHRTANEVAAATAALRLANRARPPAGARLMDRAVSRLEAFGELNRVLARPVRREANVAADLTTVCRAIAAGAAGAGGSEIIMRVSDTWLDGGTARRLVLVAAELVTNAVRHALDGRSGRLEITLGVEDDHVVLEVGDDGAGVRSRSRSSGTGLGRGIVAQLVDRGGGSVAMVSGRRGTTVRVAFPLGRPQDEEDDDHVPF